jgi:Zn-dependent protease
VVGVAVPLLGIATAVSMGVLTQAWVLALITLTFVAAVVLITSILPVQRASLDGSVVTRPAMTTGIFNLLWVIVRVLMILRPGSTTGV